MVKNKLFTLLKASMSGNMNIFKVGRKKKKSVTGKINRVLTLTFFTLLLMSLFGMYAKIIIEPLKNFNMAHMAITLFGLVTTIMIFIQGAYRSQGILFDAKDSNMLFAMPIKKSTIFAARLIKLITFQYMWNFIIMLPTIVVYAFYIKPEFTFYITAFVMIITLPIIPTIIASIFGYIIQSISSKFKMKKLVQMIGTIIFTILLMYISFNTNDYLENIVAKAQSLNEIITKIYYPMGIYDTCLITFSVSKLLGILLANISLTVLFVLVFSRSYYRVVSRLSEKHSSANYQMKKLKSNSAFWALTKKELKKYFSTPVYVFNTIVGPVMLLIASIYALISKEKLLSSVATELGGLDITNFVGKFHIIFMMFAIGVATTTACSISIEGKTFWLTKSLPVSEKKIFLAKIMVNLFITIPATIMSTIAFSYVFKLPVIDIIYCLAFAVIIPFMVSILGLIINLKYPKMNAVSDTAVVKQSASTMITMCSAFALAGIPIAICGILKIQNLDMYIGIILGVFTCFTIILWKILTTYGIKLFRDIN